MLKSYVITLFLLLNPINSHAQITFTNKCEKEVIKLINNSNETIDIAVYSINNDKIVKALEKAKNRNIKIKILTDRIQAFGKSSKVKLLHDTGFDIKIHSKDRIMHHKFAIFDNSKAVEGSFNWTNSAATKNAEDCNIFNDEKDINTLKKRFKKLWKINEKEPSECYFENMKLNKEDRQSCTLKTTKNK
jgi:mitochondrial cardiolipin hydrolase